MVNLPTTHLHYVLHYNSLCFDTEIVVQFNPTSLSVIEGGYVEAVIQKIGISEVPVTATLSTVTGTADSQYKVATQECDSRFSRTSNMGPPEIGTTSLQGHLLRHHANRDNLSTLNKTISPKVSLVRRFHCITFEVILYHKQEEGFQ